MAAIGLRGVVFTMLLAPGVLFAEPRARSALDPSEAKVSKYASRVVFAAQAHERANAERAGFGDIEQEVTQLRQALRRLEATQKGPGRAPGAGAVAPTRVRSQAREQKVRDRLGDFANKRVALTSQVAQIANPKQRGMARRALQKLTELEQETKAVLEAPAAERLPRLVALQKRWKVKKFGGPRTGGLSDPTIQIDPISQLRKVSHSSGRRTRPPGPKATSR